MFNETIRSSFTSINRNYLAGAIELLILTSISIIPNLYFFIRAFTYKTLKTQKLHRNIIIGMSLSYILASLTSLIVIILYFYHYITKTETHVYSCNVLRRIATICTNFVYVMPFFISITRFFNFVFQKSINVILFTIIVILVEVPNLSKQLSSILSRNVVRNSDSICGIKLDMNNQFINIMDNLAYAITIAAPAFGCILNFIIYKISVKKIIRCNNNAKFIRQEKSLFISVFIQSFYPLIFFGTSSSIPFFMKKFYIYNDFGWRIVDLIIYFGYSTCILISSFFVKTLKNMIFNDFGFNVVKNRSVVVPYTNNRK